MFTIYISTSSSSFTGTAALDVCRAKGLPDHSPLRIASHSTSAAVDEAFARAWFKPDDNYESVYVPLDMLIPGDLEIQRDGIAAMKRDLNPERVRELFIATQFRMLRDQLANRDEPEPDEEDEEDDE